MSNKQKMLNNKYAGGSRSTPNKQLQRTGWFLRFSGHPELTVQQYLMWVEAQDVVASL
jgi:hypothetical protein